MSGGDGGAAGQWGAPVGVLDGEVKVEGLQQDALAHEDLLLERPELLRLGLRPRGLLVLRLVRLDDDILDLLRCLLDLSGEEEAGGGDAEAVVAVVRLARVEAVVEDDRRRDAQLWSAAGRAHAAVRHRVRGGTRTPCVWGIQGWEQRCPGPTGRRVQSTKQSVRALGSAPLPPHHGCSQEKGR